MKSFPRYHPFHLIQTWWEGEGGGASLIIYSALCLESCGKMGELSSIRGLETSILGVVDWLRPAGLFLWWMWCRVRSYFEDFHTGRKVELKLDRQSTVAYLLLLSFSPPSLSVIYAGKRDCKSKGKRSCTVNVEGKSLGLALALQHNIAS